jgi:hypothetical protein
MKTTGLLVSSMVLALKCRGCFKPSKLKHILQAAVEAQHDQKVHTDQLQLYQVCMDATARLPLVLYA